jgi:predicted site-specific integrase-resolvase
MITKQLLTDSDVAELLKVPSARVLRLAKQSRIPHVVLPNGEVRFVEQDVWDWIQSHRQPAREMSPT